MSDAAIAVPQDDEAFKKQLLNRQVYAVGAEAQKKYAVCDVLVVGVSGLGLELVKNLVLSGVRSVTLVDDTPIQWADLSSMFYAQPEDVGKPRAATLLPKICELNRFVRVSAAPAGAAIDAATGLVRDELLRAHSVAVFVDKRTTLLAEQNRRCRAAGVKMVCCESRGVACSVFVDGGDGEFVVLDKNGEDTVLCVVADILPDGTIYMSDDKKHELENGDEVYFMGLPGVHGQFLNSNPHSKDADVPPLIKLFKVRNVCSPYVVQIELPAGWTEANVPKLTRSGGAESVGGFLQTTKVPQTMRFSPLEKSVTAPSFLGVIDDDPKMFAEGSLHTIFRAIHAVAQQVHSDNVTNSLDDVVAAGKALDADIDEALLRAIASTFHGNLNPMAAFVGGVAAQEVLKLASGKYRPIEQWFYYDVRELVELRPTAGGAAEFAPRNSRYDGQVAVLGKTIQQKLLDASAFIVGAGALGCEHIKNLAMIGVGCSAAGTSSVTITDMDTIELSNLSRQFLFRQKHVQEKRSKASVAAESARAMNGQFNVVSKDLRVGADSENIFNEVFWESQAVILNALDNVPARLYVDEQCVMHQRPLFESGTTGPKLNTQCVIPFLTENYGATRDPPEKEYALCTLKNFPNAIEHTIHWAKEAFGTEFTSIPTEVNSFLHTPDEWRAAVRRDPGSKAGAFKQIVDAVAQAPRGWPDCVAWARRKFEDYFSHEIKQLMYNLPLGSERDGKPVWGGAKRPPVAAEFSAANPLHMEFIVAAAALRATTYGVRLPPAAALSPASDELRALVAAVPVAEWQPRKVVLALREDDKSQTQVTEDGAAELTEADLPDPAAHAALKLAVQEFEKDDDANFHIDFMAAVSNMRATNYGIPVATRDHTKFIAGKIIPAMITATVAATGLVAMEMLKYFAGADKIQQYRNTFMNLAIPLWNLTPPTPAAKAKSYTTSAGKEISFTNWDRIDIGDGSRGDVTMQQLVDELKERYDIDTDMISTSTAKLLYTGPFTKKERMATPVTEILRQLNFPVKEDAETVTLIATGTSNDVDIDIPSIQYRFRAKGAGLARTSSN